MNSQIEHLKFIPLFLNSLYIKRAMFICLHVCTNYLENGSSYLMKFTCQGVLFGFQRYHRVLESFRGFYRLLAFVGVFRDCRRRGCTGLKKYFWGCTSFQAFVGVLGICSQFPNKARLSTSRTLYSLWRYVCFS